jgi:hypothetical protein
MKKRNNIIYLSFSFSIALMISCNEVMTNNSQYQLVKEKYVNELYDWKKDSIGCLGLRKDISNDSNFNSDDIIQLSYSQLLSTFGYPNNIKGYGSKIILQYYLSCGLSPRIKGGGYDSTFQRYSNSATTLLITMTKDSIIEKTTIAVP